MLAYDLCSRSRPLSAYKPGSPTGLAPPSPVQPDIPEQLPEATVQCLLSYIQNASSATSRQELATVALAAATVAEAAAAAVAKAPSGSASNYVRSLRHSGGGVLSPATPQPVYGGSTQSSPTGAGARHSR